MARFYKQLPRDQVLQAIHIALSQAEQQDQHPPGMISMGPPENNLTFHSNYDFQLFAVAPALQQLDTPLAAKLLAQHDEAAASLERYPQGLVSFYGGDSDLDKDALRPNHVKPPALQLYNAVEESQTLKSLDMGLEFTVPRNLTLRGVTGSCGPVAPAREANRRVRYVEKHRYPVSPTAPLTCALVPKSDSVVPFAR